MLRFNSRSREGSDYALFQLFTIPTKVSIHAPARGATAPIYVIVHNEAGFNSRSREGSDAPADEAPAKPHSFNSRSREGSD